MATTASGSTGSNNYVAPRQVDSPSNPTGTNPLPQGNMSPVKKEPVINQPYQSNPSDTISRNFQTIGNLVGGGSGGFSSSNTTQTNGQVVTKDSFMSKPEAPVSIYVPPPKSATPSQGYQTGASQYKPDYSPAVAMAISNQNRLNNNYNVNSPKGTVYSKNISGGVSGGGFIIKRGETVAGTAVGGIINGGSKFGGIDVSGVELERGNNGKYVERPLVTSESYKIDLGASGIETPQRLQSSKQDGQTVLNIASGFGSLDFTGYTSSNSVMSSSSAIEKARSSRVAFGESVIGFGETISNFPVSKANEFYGGGGVQKAVQQVSGSAVSLFGKAINLPETFQKEPVTGVFIVGSIASGGVLGAIEGFGGASGTALVQGSKLFVESNILKIGGGVAIASVASNTLPLSVGSGGKEAQVQTNELIGSGISLGVLESSSQSLVKGVSSGIVSAKNLVEVSYYSSGLSKNVQKGIFETKIGTGVNKGSFADFNSASSNFNIIKETSLGKSKQISLSLNEKNEVILKDIFTTTNLVSKGTDSYGGTISSVVETYKLEPKVLGTKSFKSLVSEGSPTPSIQYSNFLESKGIKKISSDIFSGEVRVKGDVTRIKSDSFGVVLKSVSNNGIDSFSGVYGSVVGKINSENFIKPLGKIKGEYDLISTGSKSANFGGYKPTDIFETYAKGKVNIIKNSQFNIGNILPSGKKGSSSSVIPFSRFESGKSFGESAFDTGFTSKVSEGVSKDIKLNKVLTGKYEDVKPKYVIKDSLVKGRGGGSEVFGMLGSELKGSVKGSSNFGVQTLFTTGYKAASLVGSSSVVGAGSSMSYKGSNTPSEKNVVDVTGIVGTGDIYITGSGSDYGGTSTSNVTTINSSSSSTNNYFGGDITIIGGGAARVGGVSFGFTPPFSGGNEQGLKSNVLRSSKRKTKYTSSLYAAIFNIRAKGKQVKTNLSGLGIRPLTSKSKNISGLRMRSLFDKNFLKRSKT